MFLLRKDHFNLFDTGCFEGQYAFLVSQRGPYLEVELLLANEARYQELTCYAAEAFGGGELGGIFTSADELYHIALVVAPNELIGLYVNGERIDELEVPGRRIPATYPVNVDWSIWPTDSVLAVAPKQAAPNFWTPPPAWGGNPAGIPD